MRKASLVHHRFFDLSLDLLCTANSDGFFVNVNPSFVKALGYCEEVLLSKPIVNFVHPEDISGIARVIESLMAGEGVSNFINRYKHKAGHYITLSWSATWDHETQLIYAIGRDETEQNAVKNRLYQIEQALKEETILAQTDSNGVILEVNDRFCEVSEYSRSEIIGKTHKLINSGYHSKSFFNQMWKTIKSGKIWSGVIQNKKKNGDYYFVQSILIPLKDLEGEICHYLAIRQDITSSILAEAKLSKTLGILNETGAIANIGGWELTVDTGELLWTDETFNILEVPKNDSQQPTLPLGLTLFTPEHQIIITEAVERAISHGESYALELKAKTLKGNVLWVYTTGKPNYKDGKIFSLSGTIQNINKRKIAEFKYAKERRKSIQNAKLASLGELSASVAHEINNPLGIILGNTDLMLMSKALPLSIKSKVETIEKSSERIAHIVSSLKKFSRTDHEVRPKISIPLANIVEEALILTAPKIKGILIDISFQASTTAAILCNEIEIEQIIINLINNSVDAIRQLPDKWINISLIEKNKQVVLTITDSGAGIPYNIQDKIFEPFFTSKKIGEGTGLGLSIVKGILEEHHASITIENGSANTCFVLCFPRGSEKK